MKRKRSLIFTSGLAMVLAIASVAIAEYHVKALPFDIKSARSTGYPE